MKKYVYIAGTSCDIEDNGVHASIKTWGQIANRSGDHRIIEVNGNSVDLDAMTRDIEQRIYVWRDSYSESLTPSEKE